RRLGVRSSGPACFGHREASRRRGGRRDARARGPRHRADPPSVRRPSPPRRLLDVATNGDQVDRLRFARGSERRPRARGRGRPAAAQGDDTCRPRARRLLAVIVDYHMHLRASDESIEHTVEAVERFVEQASERGIDEIGFTEHIYYFEQTRTVWTMRYHLERCVYDIEPYVDAVVEAKRRDYPVKFGSYVDYERGREEGTSEAVGLSPSDNLPGALTFLAD